MACQKVCKQGEGDSEGKYTKPHPCIIFTLVCNCTVKKMKGYGYLHHYIIPTLFAYFHPYIFLHL